ncbi:MULTISPECIES: hypothetical protein [Stappiaceae]|uniref:hypothetical protein n=1 Tax=Stappiaceae TaxID=2821832 RepID=UPI00048C48E3|nr:MULTISPECIES: hypothetical protein [Stappiaceae]
MPVSSTIQIAGENVDINTPCDVVTALRKRKIAVAAGGAELIIRMNGEEVTFNRANLSALNTLIAEYEVKCREASGSTTRGRARRIRFF